MKRVLYASLTAALLLGAVPAMAFNVRNNTNVIICAFGPENYFEEVLPQSTSRGWYYTEAPTITIQLASENFYVCVGDEHPVCAWKCNGVITQRTIPAHAQLRVNTAHCVLGDGQWCPGGPQCINACDLANIPLSFDVTP